MQQNNKVNNLVTRTITGVFFVLAILGSMIWHPVAFGGLFLLIMIIGVDELIKMADKEVATVWKSYIFLISSMVYIILMLVANQLLAFTWIAILPALLLSFFIVELYRKKEFPFRNISFSILAVIYIAIPMASMNFFFNPGLIGQGSRFYILLGFFFLLWANDIFAYLTGLAIGKHKLFERISPKKTWEGSIGGLAVALLMAWALSYFIHDLSFLEWIGMAVIIAVFGTLGDLSESLLKRQFGVKDSGTILPGHGGVLDRFDALIFAAPAVLCYLFILHS